MGVCPGEEFRLQANEKLAFRRVSPSLGTLFHGDPYSDDPGF